MPNKWEIPRAPQLIATPSRPLSQTSLLTITETTSSKKNPTDKRMLQSLLVSIADMPMMISSPLTMPRLPTLSRSTTNRPVSNTQSINKITLTKFLEFYMVDTLEIPTPEVTLGSYPLEPSLTCSTETLNTSSRRDHHIL